MNTKNMIYQDISVYQKRYLAHQARKKEKLEKQKDGEKEVPKRFGLDVALWELSFWRRSQRIFNGDEIPKDSLDFIKEFLTNTPSSCNRQAIKISIIKNIEDKQLLEQVLVGGKGWIGKADKIILLFADMEAYKSPNEVAFMPYLDAGFVGMNTYYASEAREVGCCFVNPNIREEHKEGFKNKFVKDNNYLFCGAIALGMYNKKASQVPKSSDIFV